MTHTRAVQAILACTVLVLAGCVATEEPSGTSPPDADRFVRFGAWENPDRPLVDVVTHDVTGDGFDEVFVAQRNGSVTALNPVNRTKVWQVHVDGSPEHLAIVRSDNATRLAVASDAFLRFDDPRPFRTRVAMLSVASGETIASASVDDLNLGELRAEDLDGDGLDDLVLTGFSWTAVDPTNPLENADPFDRTTIVAVDGRLDDSGGIADGAERWRTEVDGGFRTLDVRETSPPILVGTDDGLAALSADGERVFTLQGPAIVDVATQGGRVLLTHHDGAIMLGGTGMRIWDKTLDGAHRAILADLGRGPEALVAWENATDAGVRSFGPDGHPVLNTTLELSGPPSGLLQGGVTSSDADEIVVTGPIGEQERGVVYVLDADGTVRHRNRSEAGDPHDRPVLLQAQPTGGLEVAVATQNGRVVVFGAV